MLIVLLLYLVYYDNLMWENRNLSKSDFPVFIETRSERQKGTEFLPKTIFATKYCIP